MSTKIQNCNNYACLTKIAPFRIKIPFSIPWNLESNFSFVIFLVRYCYIEKCCCLYNGADLWGTLSIVFTLYCRCRISPNGTEIWPTCRKKSRVFRLVSFSFLFFFPNHRDASRRCRLATKRSCSNINTGNRRFSDLAWFRNTGSRVYTLTPEISVLVRCLPTPRRPFIHAYVRMHARINTYV